ncbi:MAG TPA: SH3 domain-containing protein, partial [Anaerolineales bacterium]
MKKMLMICMAVLLGSMTACGVPGTTTVEPPPQMQTAAAMTIDAILTGTPLATPTVAAPLGTPTAIIILPSSTPALGDARLTVQDVTNCRSGPGADYERVTQVGAGQQLKIIGSYPAFWLVETDAGSCWIAMEFSTPTGDVARVPTVTQPSTPSTGAPKAPSLARYDYVCNFQDQVELSLRWTDKSSNEAGYRIYING